MKKLFIIALSLFGAVSLAYAATQTPASQKDSLPAQANAFLVKHFPDAKIANVQMDNEFTGREYDVVLSDMTQIEFDHKGMWEKVDCRNKAVPAGIIPQPIAKFVTEKHPKNFIHEIEREGKGYKIELNDGTEIEFSQNFKVRYDY